MVKYDCLKYDGDEDCHKCCKHGFIFECDEDCPDYENFWTNPVTAEAAYLESQTPKNIIFKNETF